MRVLYLLSDSTVAEARIFPLLAELQAQGLIEHSVCLDRDLRLSGPPSECDVVIAHRNLSTRQLAWLKRQSVPFIYDIDDMLLASSSCGLTHRQRKVQASIQWCLEHASTITSPSRHLLEILTARAACSIESRAVFLPNAGFVKPEAAINHGKPDLVWVSSYAWQEEEMNAIARGIDEAARDTATETILIGRFSQTIRSSLSNHRHIAWLPREQLRRFLSSRPCIAVAPLPVGLRGDQQQFVNCKSDIKVAEYGSLGVPALFSPALPYVQSDLPRSLVATNEASEWKRRIIEATSRFPRERPSNAIEDRTPTRPPNAVAPRLLEIMRGARCARPIQIKTGFPTPRVLRTVDKLIRTFTLNWKTRERLGKTPRSRRSPSAAS